MAMNGNYKVLMIDDDEVIAQTTAEYFNMFDLKTAYIGSANLTGAGLGMKGENTRNFEAGILTSDKELVKATIDQFDTVWMGSFCKNCRRKEFCGDPIV